MRCIEKFELLEYYFVKHGNKSHKHSRGETGEAKHKFAP